MECLDIDLLAVPKKSTFKKISGIGSIILALAWLVTITIFNESPSVIYIIYCIWFVIYGIIFLLDGMGINIMKWFGEAYIRIDGIGIRVKKGVFAKVFSLDWSEVEQVEYFLLRICFTLSGGEVRELNYDNLDYGHIQEIKRVVRLISDDKVIRVIG